MNNKEENMEKLAEAILALDWSEMDEFAQRVIDYAVDDDGNPNDERCVALALIMWARDQISEALV